MHLFRPHVAAKAPAKALLICAATRLSRNPAVAVEPIRNRVLAEVDTLDLRENDRLQLRIAISVLCDLRAHDWAVLSLDQDIRVAPPDRDCMDPLAHKQHVRDGLLLERNAQLREPATRRFLSNMERLRKVGSEFRSVLDLLRDGPQLAKELHAASDLPPGSDRTGALRAIIDPYIQVVEPGIRCNYTGLDLQDMWRYFRHTWVTPYRSIPGRQISFLVRDRAASNHPIIGIGSLASSVVQQKQRDRWIGWHPKAFFERLEADRYRGWSSWVNRQFADLLADLYIEDFLEEELLTPRDLNAPAEQVIQALRIASKSARAEHRLYPQEELHKRAGNGDTDVDWKLQARTHLFRSKRAGRLAALLRARRDLLDAGFTKSSPERLHRAIQTARGHRAIKTILRLVKASHVGIDMMDIVVCGAVAPYGPLLGGKLVALLLASPDIITAYSKRYHDAASVIASSMAGRPIQRPPRLVLLMTTSLYRVASSQYNRLKIPAEDLSGEWPLEYIDLQQTAGFGSYHFSKTTMDAMEIFLARAAAGREVNSIFGEGVNPKLRKVRGALTAIGLSSDHLLKHGSPRIVYGVPLAANFRDVLIGKARRPHYILPPRQGGAADRIKKYWWERWLSGRIERAGVLDAVAEHSTAHPVTHGARVRIPDDDEDDLGPQYARAES